MKSLKSEIIEFTLNDFNYRMSYTINNKNNEIDFYDIKIEINGEYQGFMPNEKLKEHLENVAYFEIIGF